MGYAYVAIMVILERGEKNVGKIILQTKRNPDTNTFSLKNTPEKIMDYQFLKSGTQKIPTYNESE